MLFFYALLFDNSPTFYCHVVTILQCKVGDEIISTQMLKGVLENCILKIIDQEETYGYEIVQTLKDLGLTDMTEGTVYPL